MIALTGIPEITTERLTLRGPLASDFDAFADFLAGPRASMVGGPLSRVMAWRSFGQSRIFRHPAPAAIRKGAA